MNCEQKPTDRECSVAKNLVRAISKIQEAGLGPDEWPKALKSLTDALGVEGAACIVLNKRTRAVDWIFFSGLSAELESKYIERYALLDPFSPLLFVLPGWTKLSECLPSSALQKSEWHNDFVLACGVRDALGTQLVDTPSHAALFGLHRQIGRSFANETTSILSAVTDTLSAAMQRHMERLFGRLPAEAATTTVAEGRGTSSTLRTAVNIRIKRAGFSPSMRRRWSTRRYWLLNSSKTRIGPDP
jgi:hypothetical protein